MKGDKLAARASVRDCARRGLKIAGALSCSVLAIATAGPALAQNATPEPTTPQQGVEEIVVSAQRRDQRLQDVPVAVTAITPNTLVVNRVQTVNDLTGLAPGLLARENPGGLASPTFSMRGVFAIGSVASQDREIPLYVDGVYIGANRGALFELPDLERIEVLRGPQGTLFGRNSTAGAISIVTRNPSGEFAVRQELTVGNYDQLRTRTSIDLPKMGPFSAYVTYVHNERQGDIRNLGAGTQFDRTNPFSGVGIQTSPRHLGNSNAENIFAAVRFEPADDFEMVYKFDRSHQITSNTGRGLNALNPNSSIGQLILGLIATQPAGGGRFGPVTLEPNLRRPNALNNGFVVPGYTTVSGHGLTTTWQPADGFTVKNITAYRRARNYGTASVGGLDGLELTTAGLPVFARFALTNQVPGFLNLPAASQAALIAGTVTQLQGSVGSFFPFFDTSNYSFQHQFSTETQVNYDSDFMTVTAGALYYFSHASEGGLPGFTNQYRFAPLATVPRQLPLGNINDVEAKTRSYAAYVQGEFHVTPQLDVVLGGRITRDKKVGFSEAGGTFVGTRDSGTITGTRISPFDFKKTKPTYTLGLNYKPQDDILVYGKYSTGFVSGGAVAGPTSGVIPFIPETVKSGEIGFKSDLFDRRLRANFAAYFANYRNIQAVVSGANVILNVATGQRASDIGAAVISNGTLKARGFELELSAAPTRGLTINGSIGYVDSDLKNPSIFVTGGQPYGQISVAPWVGSIGAQYETLPLFDEATLFFRLDANYQGKFRAVAFTETETLYPFAAPYEFNRSQWILNGRVALRKLSMGRLEGEVGAWSRNITNNRGSTYPLLFGDFAVNTNYVAARTYGIDLIVSFR